MNSTQDILSQTRKRTVQPWQSISMHVRKRNGTLESVDVAKITERVARCCPGLSDINPFIVASQAISGIYDGVTTIELDRHLIQTAANLIGEEPEYSKLAARLLCNFIEEEVQVFGIQNFRESIEHGHRAGLISDEVLQFVRTHTAAIEAAVTTEQNDLFEYFGLRTVYDRYLLKDPISRNVIETPQYFFMRVACGLAQTLEESIAFYTLISSFEYMPSTPTLFNSGTMHPQMSSCYLLDSPQDDLAAIYRKYTDIALLSKFAGGIGASFSRVRSRGSLIRGTNGKSNGIVPFLKTLDSSVAAVNQGGKRKGAACIYLETWHADLMDFLSLRDNTGDESMRAHNLNLANWIPDLFMRRVEEGKMWSFFDPHVVPELVDLYGEAFDRAYVKAETENKFSQQIDARELYGIMMKTLAQTGNGWITFKDASNKKSSQTLLPQNVIHLSNLCTEILEVTSDDETAVCNLGSIHAGRYVKNNSFDFVRLGENVRTAIKFLDRVIDINFYPIPTAAGSNHKWRPVGLGVMGLQNVFFQMGYAFDDEKAKVLSREIQEEIYFHALSASCELAKAKGPHAAFKETRAAQGFLQFDLWGVKPRGEERWENLRHDIKEYGLRNSLLIAIAPTATIASITGAYECIEPQVSNLFKRETLSGEFLQINPYLVTDLRRLGLWNKAMRDEIKMGEGSVQHIETIPEDIRLKYRTVWEIPQKSLIDMASDRGPFIDQSQSLNLFMESPTIGKMSSMYMYAWKSGLKTLYYLRSRSATRIKKVTVGHAELKKKEASNSELVSCSLENPEACESCT